MTGNPSNTVAPAPSPSPPLPDRFWWQAAALALFVLAAYANSLRSSFHFDDAAIFADPWILRPGFGWGILRLNQTRPLTYLTFHWNYLLGGQNPLLYHWVNLLLHAANSILLLAVARRYLSPFAAVCVAVFFALHPLQTESVTYVFARSTLWSTHFALWALWLYARAKRLPSALLFGVSLLAKEEAIALPAFLLLLELFERRRPKAGYFALLAGLAALAAARLAWLLHVLPNTNMGSVRGLSAFHYALTEGRVLWIYLRLIAAPFGLNLDRDVRFSTGLLAPWTTLPALLALAWLGAVLVFLAWKKRSSPALWALGFFVLIAPSSSVVVQADAIFEHRAYLPLVPLAIALGFLLQRIPRAPLAIAVAVLIPAMLAGTVSRNADWRDETTLWTDIARKSPLKGRAWLGMASLCPDDPEKAAGFLRRGLSVHPGNASLHTSLGVALLRLRRPAEALEQFQRAMALSGPTADAWNNIGAACFRMHDMAGALNAFERALQSDPCNFNARRNTMMLYSQRNLRRAAWDAGAVPPACTLLPAQAGELETLRRLVAAP